MNPIDYKFVMLLSNKIGGFTVKSSKPLKVNCRCPLCGDSQKSSTKKRGWFTESKDNARFGCFNCGSSMWLSQFLERYEPVLHRDYFAETKMEWLSSRQHLNVIPIAVEQKIVKEHTINGIKKISQLSYDHPARKYINSRQVPTDQHYRLYYTPKFNKYVNTLIPDKLNEANDEPRLVIPFFSKDKRFIGFTGRSFKPNGLRYITIILTDDPKVFGLDVVDFSKENYCVEGPLDSLFLNNCWAMAGSDVSDKIGNENTIYIYDNEPHNKEIVKKIEKKLKNGDKVVIWPERVKSLGKDINDYICSGLTSDEINGIIKTNTFSGLLGILELTKWKRV